MDPKISVVMVVYNEEKLIGRCLDSVKDIANEILILHDGPCKDKTLKIAKKYTKKIFVNKENIGVPGPLLSILFRKAKGPWILKIDSDEFLSKELKRDINKLVQNSKVAAYSFRWPFWDGKKYITKNWPRKTNLYRKSKISYFAFPHWDDPRINGDVLYTNYHLEHRPFLRNPFHSLKELVDRGLKKYARLQAEYTLKDFNSFDSFQYKEKVFPFSIKIRRKFPLFSAIPFGVLAFFKVLSSRGAWKEGKPAFVEACQSLIYYFYVGYLIYKLKKVSH